MTEIRPSTVRVRALHEYELLRRTIDELDDAATRLLAEGDVPVDEALAVVARLLRELSEYIDLEQELVLPTVRRVDIWGGIRADSLAKDHESKRDDLGAIERAHEAPVDPRSLAEDLKAFARELRASLQREAQDVLGPDMLRDDVVETAPD